MEQQKRQRCFSAIQPTGQINIGGYLGAIKNWIKLQDQFDCIFAVADLHSITVRQTPSVLRRNSMDMLAILLACGVDADRHLLFLQSHVPAHTQLAWVLDCYTMFGELGRMTQFKDKSAKNADNINAGLFTYPVLMAADILLYQTDVVPVGEDQRQHLELTKIIAKRFNSLYGEVFTIPEGRIPEIGAKIRSLTDPSKKMSKSDENENSCVNLLDSRDVIIRKFKKAVTDSEARVYYGEGKDGINNLMSIYSSFTGKSYDDIEKEFDGKGYGDFKLAVGETVADKLKPIQDRYCGYMSDKAQLEQICRTSAERAAAEAEKTLRKVYRKTGFAV